MSGGVHVPAELVASVQEGHDEGSGVHVSMQHQQPPTAGAGTSSSCSHTAQQHSGTADDESQGEVQQNEEEQEGHDDENHHHHHQQQQLSAAAHSRTPAGTDSSSSNGSQPWHGRPECFVITHSVAKRHNVGTIARCATAFGVKEVGHCSLHMALMLLLLPHSLSVPCN